MKQKEKLSETKIRCEEVEKDGNRYRYELIMRESRLVASYKLPLYSVTVHMECENGNATYAESKEVFADAGHAIIFFEKLVKNLATPIDLPYIIEDELTK